MSAVEQVRRTRRWLALSLGLRIVSWTVASGAAVFALGAATAVLYPMPATFHTATPWLALLGALGTLVVLAWRERYVTSLPRVALWIEERAPDLRYALVTGIEPRYVATMASRLEPALSRVRPERIARTTFRTMWKPLVLLGIAVLALGLLPPAITARPMDGGTGAGTFLDADAPSRLTPLRAIITPPAYAAVAGAEPEELEDPVTVAALAGSEVVLLGPGVPDGIEAWIGDSVLVLTGSGEGWSAAFTLSTEPGLLRLQDREYERLLVLAPELDNAPRAQLISPARDTTLRTAEGNLLLEARFSDESGLRKAWFEYIVTSGEGEGSYTYREGRLGERDLAHVNQGEIQVRIPLSHFELGPGDRLSIRAVTQDNNTWSGPGIGFSETRLLRVSRPSEYDSLAVAGAPPAVDSTLMTLRYLILLTEELETARNDLERAVFVDSSVALGRRTEALRDRVMVLQQDQTMGGLFERNTLLDAGYIALVQGASELRIGEPGSALPHLRDALSALTEYAQAERYYTRGGTPEILVDLARVRLAGSDTGYASPRTARKITQRERQRLRTLYAEAVQVLGQDRERALGQLLELQVESLRLDPTLAAVLGSAITDLRSGGGAAPQLRRIRLLLDGKVAMTDTLPRWNVVW